jgi:hypothetical protein
MNKGNVVPKKQRPPDRPEDRFFANFLEDGKFFDKDGNRVYPKKKIEVAPADQTDLKIESTKTEGS